MDTAAIPTPQAIDNAQQHSIVKLKCPDQEDTRMWIADEDDKYHKGPDRALRN